MTRPWDTVAAAERAEGRLELRRRGDHEVVITLGGRVLMNGAAHLTEEALAELACRAIQKQPRPRILIGGLGLGYTLRAALRVLPPAARLLVAEIDPTIVEWCRGPLAALTQNALADRRVKIEIADVAAVIARSAREQSPAGASGSAGRLTQIRLATGQGRTTSPSGGAKIGAPATGFDAILLDLYEGPHAATQGREDPLYGLKALTAAGAALNPGGVFAVWSEDPDAAFEKRLGRAGFAWERHRPGRGGPRHTLYLARRRR